jgi:hypothetical protein
MYVLWDGSQGGIRLSSDAGICAPADLVRCYSQHLRMPTEWGWPQDRQPTEGDIVRFDRHSSPGVRLGGISIVLSTG